MLLSKHGKQFPETICHYFHRNRSKDKTKQPIDDIQADMANGRSDSHGHAQYQPERNTNKQNRQQHEYRMINAIKPMHFDDHCADGTWPSK